MAPYHRLDIGFDYAIEKKKFTSTWSFGAYNAYSRRNPFFLNLENVFVDTPEGGESRTVLRQYSLFPLIPSVSYKIDF